ncbi:MAG: AAA family ATPase [Anaerolineae bacterium]|nr:AAA family ATPase [Anaerolineae bacterium]
MRLKRLEVQGFKSFAERTEFVFPTGITAIVGPNGSGKSNIADAIRWALGEQSLRLLRGKTTEDMLFSGSGRRQRVGMAEVLLTLDNGDGWLPVPFSEVTLGRRAYRSGENEYLLNGKRVRLRDLMDLLAESGLAQRTYTVIGQGLVDLALSLQPQERRALFEEAAGITIYRARREESVARLEETARNLERVRDLLNEIAPRLKRLEEQVARLQEYERVSDYLRQLQRVWYGYHWGRAQEALREARERARAAEEHLAARKVEVEALSARLADLRRRESELRNGVRDLYRRVADLHDRMDAAGREAAALTERVRLLEARGEEIQAELEPLRKRERAQAERVQAAQAQERELAERVAALEARVAELEQGRESLRREARAAAERRARAEADLQALRNERDRLEKSLAEARALQARLEAELDLLSRMREEMDDLTEGARLLLRAGIPGVVGILGQLVQVEPEWERAVEAALGPLLGAVVVEDWETVRTARRFLGEKGRAILIPLAEIRVRPHPSPPACDGDSSEAVGGGVRCEERFRPLVEALLGRVWLADDLEEARARSASLPPGGRCVTRAGEVVAADGTVTVGRGSGRFLARERRWRELPAQLEAVRRRREELEAELRRMEAEIGRREGELAQLHAAEEEVRAREAQAEAPLAQARTDLALARQALENHRALLARERTALERIRGDIVARERRAAELERERKEAARRLAALKQETAEAEAALAEARARIRPAEEELNRLAQESREAEAQERQAAARVRQAEEFLSHARLEVARAQDGLARLQERIQEDLGLVDLEVREQFALQQPLPLQPLVSSLPIVEALPEGLEEEIGRLKARLRRLGPVNPAARQEYAEVEERYRFLSEQVADLEAASARLREVIAELDRMMEQAFRETFEAVAAAFEENFTRLFNGGSARLELTDPDDLAHTGVDIIARPPGKRLQSLALLSGGERALTAVALIFAILQVRPTPFCVLDEVDAMLDEANVARFRALLEELAETTQFIVITHNRGTVEAADTVYGISMGPDGTSQVLSLRLDEGLPQRHEGAKNR